MAFQGVNGKVDGKPDGFGYTAELGKAGANRVADSTPVGYVKQLGEFKEFTYLRGNEGAPIGSPGGVRGTDVGEYVASGRCRNRQMSSRVVRS